MKSGCHMLLSRKSFGLNSILELLIDNDRILTVSIEGIDIIQRGI